MQSSENLAVVVRRGEEGCVMIGAAAAERCVPPAVFARPLHPRASPRLSLSVRRQVPCGTRNESERQTPSGGESRGQTESAARDKMLQRLERRQRLQRRRRRLPFPRGEVRTVLLHLYSLTDHATPADSYDFSNGSSCSSSRVACLCVCETQKAHQTRQRCPETRRLGTRQGQETLDTFLPICSPEREIDHDAAAAVVRLKEKDIAESK